ncbi:MAG: enoyl-CoA hydratase/isomerase family protein [bacterium]|nr:enoyl-CoA hydratase/isomerase family protein [bacterium]
MQASNELKVNQIGRLVHVELNRPHALNALSLGMLQELRKLLADWESDPGIAEVVVSGAGERAFCAGADVKQVYLETQPELPKHIPPNGAFTDFRSSFGERYFRCEYELDDCISRFGKPYMACMDGITMGGGVGISVLGSLRLATDRTVLAMPETAIGFFPDVGASHFLSRLGPVGTFMALTGQSIDGRTALELGLATHYLEHERLDELWDLSGRKGLLAALEELAVSQAESERLVQYTELADRCFSQPSVRQIMDCLEEQTTQAEPTQRMLAAEALTKLKSKSPLSLEVTWEALRRGSELPLRECLQMDFRICARMLARNDFYEGVRAVLVDKDKSPDWQPSRLDEVAPEDVLRCFDALGPDELQLG